MYPVLTEWETLDHVVLPLLDLMHVCSYTAFIYCFCSKLLYYFGVKIDAMTFHVYKDYFDI